MSDQTERKALTEEEKVGYREALNTALDKGDALILLTVEAQEDGDIVSQKLSNINIEQVALAFHSVIEEHPAILLALVQLAATMPESETL